MNLITVSVAVVCHGKEPAGFLKKCLQLYLCHHLECHEALGMEDGAILNGQISASSQLDANHAAIQGRLNSQATASKAGSWSAFTSDVDQWLQVDLGNLHSTVTRVATQGGNTHSQWVTNYTLGYSDDGINFHFYKEQGRNESKVGYASSTESDKLTA